MCRSSAAERTRSSITAFFSFCMLQAEGDVVVHLHVRKDRVALEHHRDAPSSRGEVGGIAVADVHAPVVDALESCQAAQERRLAATRRTEQDHELPVLHLEVDAVHRGEVAEGLAHPLEADLSHVRPFQPTSFSGHPPPGRDQVLADEEDDDQRRRQQEEAAGEAVRRAATRRVRQAPARAASGS